MKPATVASPACAGCGNGNVQKLSAIVSAGTSRSQGTGVAFGLDGGMAVGVGGATTATTLASTLAPPSRPTRRTNWFAVLFWSFSIPAALFLMLLLLVGKGDHGGPEPMTLVSMSIGASIVLGVLALALRQKRKPRFDAEVNYWGRCMTTWQRLWYCDKCHSVSDLDAGKAAPAHSYRGELL